MDATADAVEQDGNRPGCRNCKGDLALCHR
jgi:hypothetical protein